ncbi:bla regulator protein BlaR1 [Clostridium tetanomorphum]|uniref:Beta-lactam sensor/signal transducer n=1 Tax=Clostridium tetanomorphum TaxID=1553 RepID=A0A923EBN1_CLOTT|nr:M56 family metallopeptidase [Clostridium tetanomorphum]KAJ49165.1 M56 family peptidase [Clostridium tetanomorphum DSM 665]KAJ50318.1 M56 family peptidase [Clostridium tetanomorphum DSM 665]MBC2397979.1 beta-lactam sensor/signal transducer [Clostridium tetanomorphum]MBP1864515.1 bla regulator protein BlaR1 [Clostridium tetanomorphum]NRS82953.1 bla regulator protein BlaR1 [Clostridium tetanomorphum]
MDILVRIFLCVLQVSLTASIAALLIILILKLFNSRIGIRFQHALLLIIIVRLIIPVNIQSNINLLGILFQKYENKILKTEGKSTSNSVYNFFREGKVYLSDDTKDNKTSSVSSSEKISYNQEKIRYNQEKIRYNQEKITRENVITNALKIVSCIWLVGVFSITLFFIIVVWKFKRKTLNLEQLTELKVVSLIEECKKKVSINRSIPIYACDNFKTPCILGVLKPRIYIPKYEYSINNYKNLSHILLHELIHYKRKDLLYNFLGTVALLIHWFNPVVWFLIKRMKLQRECACDACVLETLGEEEAIEYGMTLINFSKLISSSREVPQLAIFFETKSEIRRRIEMIKSFKKGSYKMSAAAAICCVLAGGIIFTSGVTARDIRTDNIVTAVNNKNSIKKQEEDKFLIDSPIKLYNNLKKAEEIAGFKFKVPDYLPAKYRALPDFKIIKISDKANVLKIDFQKPAHKVLDNKFFSFQASKENMEKVLKQDAELISEDAKVEISKKAISLGGINGYNITIFSNGFQNIRKYFVWQNEGIWYSIEYGESGDVLELSIDDIGKVASSIKYVEDIKNVDYSVKKEFLTETEPLLIYDKDDLKKAKELLGFTPKFPININKDITIDRAKVRLSEDSDIKNEKFNYEFNMNYISKVDNLFQIGAVSFSQRKDSKNYDDAKKKVNSIKIDGKEVFKYEETYEESEENKRYIYIWKENEVYCEVSIGEGNGNSDEIAKEFINSKPIN